MRDFRPQHLLVALKRLDDGFHVAAAERLSATLQD